MGKYFVRDTPLAGLEREMMLPPNFAPRRSSSAILCGYSPHGADVDCRSFLDHRRQSRRTLVCPHGDVSVRSPRECPWGSSIIVYISVFS